MPDYWRQLPHFHPEEAYLFVTWRLAGSTPAVTPEIIYKSPGHRFAAEDRELAKASGPKWLADTVVAAGLAETLLDGQRQHLYNLIAWCIMPNHVHILILPHEDARRIMQFIKGRSAHEANSILGRAGQPFWQHESYDHWVRNERELIRIANYIEYNPVAAGLVQNPEDWRFSSPGKDKRKHVLPHCAANSRD